MPGLQSPDLEVALLARVLGNDGAELPVEIARYLVAVGFNQHDKDHMHELAVRNRRDELSEAEKRHLLAYARTGTVLSILKSKARRVLKRHSNARTTA